MEETEEIIIERQVNGKDAKITIRLPKIRDNSQPIRILKKDIVKVEYLEHLSGRLPRKEKKRLKKLMKIQGKSRAKIVKKSICLRTGNFQVRINRK